MLNTKPNNKHTKAAKDVVTGKLKSGHATALACQKETIYQKIMNNLNDVALKSTVDSTLIKNYERKIPSAGVLARFYVKNPKIEDLYASTGGLHLMKN